MECEKKPLWSVVVNKETGYRLYSYRDATSSTHHYIATSCMYGTNLTNSKPHNIASLYALQMAQDQADWDLLKSHEDQTIINNTSEKDPMFNTCIKTLY
jgi:hypothetical protein